MKKIERATSVTLPIAKDLRIGQNLDNFMHWVKHYKEIDIFNVDDKYFHELYNEWLLTLKK